MLGNFINKVKKSFTLLEVLIICGAFSIVIVSIIGAINRSYAFMSSTRMKVRAVNFAREGVEMMFNMRDTNWREKSGEKDEYWLGTGSTELGKGIYVLKERANGSGDMKIYASGLNVSDIDNFYNNFRNSKVKEQARLSFTGAYDYLTGKYDDGIWKFEQTTGNLQDLLGNDGEFYRIVRVYDIVNKIEDCTADSCPKEMHFCVKIFYRHQGEHETELCSMMTNFEE